MATLLLVFLLELGLSFGWNNPYLIVNESSSEHTRFNPKNMIAYAKVDRLYQGEHDIRFAITQEMSVDGGKHYDSYESFALGGSTTESGLVPEGQRWPDLLTAPALNYGVSGNTSIDGYYNLKYLIQNHQPPPKKVFVMFGINDLRAYFNKGADNFKIIGWKEPFHNPLAVIDQVNEKVLSGLRIKDSALLSFFKYQTENFLGRSFYASYYSERLNQEQMENISQAEFRNILKIYREQFLPARADVYKALSQLATNNNIKIILLTQPHAYREAYTAFLNDLRLYPVYKGKKLNLKQTALLLNEMNVQTKELAELFGYKNVDTAKCFNKLSPSKLFYDSVHYTLEGSQQFARCVNESL